MELKFPRQHGPWARVGCHWMRGRIGFLSLQTAGVSTSDSQLTARKQVGRHRCLLVTVEAKEVVHLYGEEYTLMDSHGK